MGGKKAFGLQQHVASRSWDGIYAPGRALAPLLLVSGEIVGLLWKMDEFLINKLRNGGEATRLDPLHGIRFLGDHWWISPILHVSSPWTTPSRWQIRSGLHGCQRPGSWCQSSF